MKAIISILLFSCFFISSNIFAQQSEVTQPEIFEHKSGDTTYMMQKYFLCLLKTGPSRNHDDATAQKIQGGHMAHLSWLTETEKICIAGPSQDHDVVQGFVLYRVATQEEAEKLANMDPAVKAGRLTVEVLPWWAAQGSKLY